MTLHWWMHWFWVTAQLVGILASPLPSTTQDPIIERAIVEKSATRNSRIIDSGIEDRRAMIEDKIGVVGTGKDEDYEDKGKERGGVSVRGFRVAKAISSHDSTTNINKAVSNENPTLSESSSEFRGITRKVSSLSVVENDGERATLGSNRINVVGITRTSNMIKSPDDPNFAASLVDSSERESDVTWVVTTRKTPARIRKKNNNERLTSRPDIMRNLSSNVHEDRDNEDLSVLPLRIESATRLKLVVNSTRRITADESAGRFSTRTFNGSEDIEIDEELAEPRLSATAASILQAGMSESTRLSRARNAFTSDFQRDHREEDRSSDIDVNQVLVEADDERIDRGIESSSSPTAVDIAAITASCLATILLLGTMASLGFIMYRRKYLNPPQTLNSDKCSNPDSSGYIDDSTIRDNSEEMYSLDNDSFLNSLEAMTIQNYWTDSVKHTKL